MPEPTAFPLHAWRRAVELVSARIGTDALAPFGFELTGSRRYLFSRLRYLFLYITRSSHLPGEILLVRTVRAALEDALAEVAATIEIVDYNRHVFRTSIAAGSRTLVIRPVETRRPLLDTWARYVVATALSVNRTRLSATTDFHRDLMAQRYCCQLATMHQALFSSTVETPSIRHPELIRERLQQLQHVGLDERYNVTLVDPAVTCQLDDAIERFYAQLNEHLESFACDGADDPVPDFHGAHLLELRRGAVFETLTQLAVQRYRSYAAAEARPAPRDPHGFFLDMLDL